MRRRDFIVGLGGAAAWPAVARAQRAGIPVIGFLHLGRPNSIADQLAGFRQGLKDAGYVEGRNVAVEYRWADDHFERLAVLAADLVSRRVAVIIAGGGLSTALAAKAATSIIPIVIAVGFDPVRFGLVPSLNRPGGNITGVTVLTTELAGKRLALLREIVPKATAVAYLTDNPKTTSLVYEEQMSTTLAAARVLGQQLIVVEATSEKDFEAAFATLIERQVGALIVGTFPLFISHREELLALAARHKIPAIYQSREFPLDGGLMSYGGDYAGAYRRGGVFVGRILKGEKPADLPFEQTTKFELVINLKTAKTLGLTVPETLLATADEIIQ